MKTQQALDFLIQLASSASVPLQTHMQAQQAYKILKEALEKQSETHMEDPAAKEVK